MFLVLPRKPFCHLKNIMLFLCPLLKFYAKVRVMFYLLAVAIFRFRCLYFSVSGNRSSTSGAPQRTILAPEGNLGRLWEQQDGFEMVLYRISYDFGVILGPVYMSFSSLKTLELHFLFGLVSQPFCDRCLNRHFNLWEFQLKVSAWRVLQKLTFR